MFYAHALESNAVILSKFWRPLPTLPLLRAQNCYQQEKLGQWFHFLQCRGSWPSPRFVNRRGGSRISTVSFRRKREHHTILIHE